MSESEATLDRRQPRRWWPVFASMTGGILLGLMVWFRVWVSGVETFDKAGEFTTPARPPTEATYDPGPGLPPGYRGILALTEPETSKNKGLLTREIVRQGVMLAAQDVMQLDLLDSSLGDEILLRDPADSYPVSLVTVLSPFADRFTFQVELSHPVSGQPPLRWTSPEIRISNDPVAMVQAVEGFSRDEFVAFLKKAGFQKTTGGTDHALPSEPADKDRLDVVSQFVWIRHLHGQLRTNEPSPELLGDLVRAYANLGNLTDFHWSASSKAFKARALLYAQRLEAISGRTPYSLAHQAYAQALTGLHNTALNQAQASRSAEGMAAPGWLDLIEAYCAYKTGVLEAEQGPHAELAAYLRLRMYDMANDQVVALAAVRRFVERNPACGRAVEMLGEAQDKSVQRELLESGYPRLWPVVYQRLAETSDLPEAARAIAAAESQRTKNSSDEYESRHQFIIELQTAAKDRKDVGIPSWNVLAGLLHEESFVQAWRIADARINWLHADPEAVLVEVKPLVEGHHLAPVLQCFANPSDRQLQRPPTWKIDTQSLDMTARPLVVEFERQFGPKAARPLMTSLSLHSDNIYEDTGPKWPDRRIWNVTLRQASPHWPLAVADSIQFDRPDDRLKLNNLEATYNKYPVVLNAIAARHHQHMRPHDAIRCWKKSVKLSPAGHAYRSLATLYREEGNFDAWSQTLEEALQRPCYGKESDRFRQELAEAYLRRGDWEKAQSHAVIAAQGGTEQGLRLAARCAEALKNWDDAEAYVQQVSLRFPQRSADWHFWCVRTGHGNAAAAKQLATDFWNPVDGKRLPLLLWSLGAGQVLAGDMQSAKFTIHDLYLQYGDTAAGTLAAVIADLQGQTAGRDALFDELARHWVPPEGIWIDFDNPANQGKRFRDPFPELTNLMRSVLKGYDWNPREFELLVINAQTSDIPELYFLAGVFLAYHGVPERANEYLRYAAASPRSNSMGCVLANHALRNQGITVETVQRHDVPDAIVPLVSYLKWAAATSSHRNLDRAESLVDQALRLQPDFLPALLLKGEFQEVRKDYAAAIATYEGMLKIDGNYSAALYRLAWLRAACPEDRFRTGAKALELARHLRSLRHFETYTFESTFAAATAESGDIKGAERIEMKSMGLPGNRSSPSAAYREYSAGRPYRQSPPSGWYFSPQEQDVMEYDLPPTGETGAK